MRKLFAKGAIRSFRGTEIVKEIHQTLTKLKAIHPDSQLLIDAVIDPASTLKNRPAADDLQSWNRYSVHRLAPQCRKVAASSHSAVANCSKCHLHSGRGNCLGPDLPSLWRSATITHSDLYTTASLHIDPHTKPERFFWMTARHSMASCSGMAVEVAKFTATLKGRKKSSKQMILWSEKSRRPP